MSSHLKHLRPSPATVLAFIALIVAMSGSAVAASLITSKQIKDGTIQPSDLSKKAKTAMRGAPGPAGPKGADGAPGAPGPQGEPGPASGPAGGVLDGNYPNPTLRNGVVTDANLAPIPTVEAYHDGAVTVPTGVTASVPLDGESFDTAEMHSTSTSPQRLTAPKTGVYLVSGSGRWTGGAAAHTRFLAVRRNAVEYVATDWRPATSDGNQLTDQTVTGPVKLNKGDFVDLVAFQDSGSSQNLTSASGSRPKLSMTWLAQG